MKRFLVLLLLFTTLTSLQAQRRKTVKKKPEPQLPEGLNGMTVERALNTYDFAAAETLLKFEIANLEREKLSTIGKEEQLAWVQKAQIKLNAVERVTFIDSLIVPRNEVLRHIHLSPECGTLLRTGDFFQTQDTLDCTAFVSQLGDQVFYAQADKTGNVDLYMRDLYGDGSSSAPRTLDGISGKGNSRNYPYMMTDGLTIYFAAQGNESLGGYDIFMSRYDSDEHKFLAPENIGMPFNSPANDYLYVIDEFNNLGWFVTDRNMPENSVCIYIFIPNETRKVYIPEEVGNERLRKLARITSIRDTWSDENAVRQAQLQLQKSRQEMQETTTEALDFVLTDNVVYHRKSDFHTPLAQQTFAEWEKNKEELRKIRKTLNLLRNNYHTANQTQRGALKSEILQLEQNEENLVSQIKKQENAIRKAELGL
ncbi:MAG: hypothetical protein K2O17_07655 [Bacteroidaceae bacterium]|nr:hypothetical protein [Bacteroidaceae bacterium]